jgi:hypothetical protein
MNSIILKYIAMKKYTFLIKPAFFIFNLIFAMWLVLKIEQLRPSDFGRFKSLFEPTKIKQEHIPSYDKYYIKKLANDYKKGVLDSVTFNDQLEQFIDATAKTKTTAVK